MRVRPDNEEPFRNNSKEHTAHRSMQNACFPRATGGLSWCLGATLVHDVCPNGKPAPGWHFPSRMLNSVARKKLSPGTGQGPDPFSAETEHAGAAREENHARASSRHEARTQHVACILTILLCPIWLLWSFIKCTETCTYRKMWTLIHIFRYKTIFGST